VAKKAVVPTKAKTKKAKERSTDPVVAHAKYLRISPNKLRRIANEIRGKESTVAVGILKNLPHKGARMILAVLNSATSNAVENHGFKDGESLRISEIRIDEGPQIKRYQPRARGRMYQIIKRNSHIFIGLEGV
jgi:large subunit ribosomal protein L22